MTVFLPDSNILVDALNAKRGRSELLRDLLSKGHRLACCPITVAEVYSGMRSHEAAKTDQFLWALVWYDVSRDIARQAGRWRFEWARQGSTLSLPDVLIAATVLEHGLTLITDNRRHFPMPGLSIYPLPATH